MAIRIFVDQGHNPVGQVNAGAVGNGVYESDINFWVGLYLAQMLEADPRFEVRLSRQTETDVLGTSNSSSLAARVNMANSWPADYFISIHCNANVNPAINGTEAYVYAQNTQAYWLGQHLVNGIVAAAGTLDNGVRTNTNLYVLRQTTMPSVLVELAYVSNAADAANLSQNTYAFAQGIYQGLLTYFGFAPL